jgi:hypothetical protein
VSQFRNWHVVLALGPLQHCRKRHGLFFGHVRLRLALYLPQRLAESARNVRMAAMHRLNLSRQRYENLSWARLK